MSGIYSAFIQENQLCVTYLGILDTPQSKHRGTSTLFVLLKKFVNGAPTHHQVVDPAQAQRGSLLLRSKQGEHDAPMAAVGTATKTNILQIGETIMTPVLLVLPIEETIY